MISVVIPLNEDFQSWAPLAAFASCAGEADEILLVHDGFLESSPDVEFAKVRAIFSPLPGLGAKMLAGLKAARNEIVLFIDADLIAVREDLASSLTFPIAEGWADYVIPEGVRYSSQSSHSSARKVLYACFPEMMPFPRPFGGTFAAKKTLLEKLAFEMDCGCSVGLLIDAYRASARICAVDVGGVLHDLPLFTTVRKRVESNIRAIVDRACRYGCLDESKLAEIQQEVPNESDSLEFAWRHAHAATRFALVDLDELLFQESADLQWLKRGGKNACHEFSREPLSEEEKFRLASSHYAGVLKDSLEEFGEKIVFRTGAKETVAKLRKFGALVGLVSDGLRVFAKAAQHRLGADFYVSNRMQYRQNVATGEVIESPIWRCKNGCQKHDACKSNVVRHLSEYFQIAPSEIAAAGLKGRDDCLLNSVGQAFVFERTENLHY